MPQYMLSSDFDFGEVIKVFACDEHQNLNVFVGMMKSKAGNAVAFEKLVHLNNHSLLGNAVIFVEHDTRCFDIPTEVELSDWMDLNSSVSVKYSEILN